MLRASNKTHVLFVMRKRGYDRIRVVCRAAVQHVLVQVDGFQHALRVRGFHAAPEQLVGVPAVQVLVKHRVRGGGQHRYGRFCAVRLFEQASSEASYV